ncbi:MAG: serine hydrolase [Alphaproteobacteria bacterium]|nr:serine hydrolase [Alphaproteobacteria bacterium]
MELPPLPTQPEGVPWPTQGWPRAMDAAIPSRASALLAEAFDRKDLGETQAVLIVQRGRIIFERYGEGGAAEDTFHSWSMAKSITHALTGLLVADGVLDVRAPVDAPEWRAPGDPRAAITLDHLLRMQSGLAFTEEYRPDQPSDVIAMLFGEGKHDVAHFAASFPLAHPPGAHMAYASGSTNIIARRLGAAIGKSGAAFEAFMRARLFAPLGMASPIPKFDAAGTFIGSSFCFATAQDFARFGLLYLRGGVWEGRQHLPREWIDHARTPTNRQPGAADGPYGAHWWLETGGPGSFSANGYDGQYIVLAPDLDLILVRHGRTPLDLKEPLKAWIAALVDAFR